MTPPIIVETELGQVLSLLSQQLVRLQQDVNDLKIGQVRLETELAGNRTDIADLKEALSTLQNTQKAQVWTLVWALVWTLIGVLSIAVVGLILRFVLRDFWAHP